MACTIHKRDHCLYRYCADEALNVQVERDLSPVYRNGLKIGSVADLRADKLKAAAPK